MSFRYSDMLDLALNLQASLQTHLPALIADINTQVQPSHPIVMPVDLLLGVRVEMIKRNTDQLPVLACGVYLRQQEESGEQEWSTLLMPFVIEVFIGGNDASDLYIQATKWGMVIDKFVEQYASTLLAGWTADEAPDIDISYVLENRDGTFRHLVATAGVFVGSE